METQSLKIGYLRSITKTPNDMKKFILNEIVKQNSTIRLVLATIALGMGLNAPCIQRIIHCRPPTTMEKYMQEIGRA